MNTARHTLNYMYFNIYLHSSPIENTGGMATANNVMYHMFYENIRQSTSVWFLCAAINVVDQETHVISLQCIFLPSAQYYLAICVILQIIFFHWCIPLRPPKAYWHRF